MPPRSKRARSPPPVIDPRCLARPAADPAAVPIADQGDEHLHSYLRFTDADDRADRDRLLLRASAHGYEPLHPINWTSLSLAQLEFRATETCGPHWRNLFSISDAVCTELTVEFFSTVHLLSPLTDYDREDALTFRLGGQERRLSIRRFAVLMGLYTEEECDTPIFRDGITDWPEGVSPQQFWTTIGVGAHAHPVPKSTRLRDPLHRVLHRAIVFSLATSSSSSGSVTLSDLFYLFCIISERPCQIAVCLARYLFSARQGRETQSIYGGGYIHRLARAMDILTPADFEALTLSHLPVPIDMSMMIRMRVARKDGMRYILLGMDEQPYVLPVQAGDGPPVDAPAIELEQPAQQPSPRRPSPPPARRPERVFQRPERFERDLYAIRDRVDRMEEMQRLEYEYAESFRQYQIRVFQMIAGRSTEPLPDPPVRPQRLTDLLSGASSSGSRDSWPWRAS